MQATKIIAHYESLSNITGQMRSAAINSEWDNLLNLEQQCNQQVALMKPLDTMATLDESAQQHKIQLIKKILSDDAEIRSRTATWIQQLQNIMHSNRQEYRLQQAYRA